MDFLSKNRELFVILYLIHLYFICVGFHARYSCIYEEKNDYITIKKGGGLVVHVVYSIIASWLLLRVSDIQITFSVSESIGMAEEILNNNILNTKMNH